MTDDAPKIASSLVRSDLFLPVLLFFDGILMLPHYTAILMIAFCPVAGFFVARDLSTKLTSDGVSQLTWRGRVHLGWEAVLAVKRKANSIVLHGATARIVIAYQRFYDSGATVRFVDSHLPRNLRE